MCVSKEATQREPTSARYMCERDTEKERHSNYEVKCARETVRETQRAQDRAKFVLYV